MPPPPGPVTYAGVGAAGAGAAVVAGTLAYLMVRARRRRTDGREGPLATSLATATSAQPQPQVTVYFSSSAFSDPERALPAEADHFVVAAPAVAFLEAGLRRRARAVAPFGYPAVHRDLRAPSGRSARRRAAARTRRRRRSRCARLELHDGAAEDAAEPAEHLVAEVGRRPLDRVGPERARRRHGVRDLPPGAERVGVEERL